MAENFGGNDEDGGFKDLAEQLLPIANVGRIMKQILPPNAKVSKEAKETMQECVSEFISFVTSEASDKCKKERRKTVSGDDICTAMSALGFDDYAGASRRYLHRYRELEGDRAGQERNNAEGHEGPSDVDYHNNQAGSSDMGAFNRRTDRPF
ncbi:hypothetical protein MLD38_023564 [Melastoma candidum]|uniref:Uncharacterized protein n=1 Tax=Melastoma candidum TaxID=119954 RepID=A0ACB9NPT3_9MYRT|nr:hypothetical protein MLD38_023564 [Melastoma candidum]